MPRYLIQYVNYDFDNEYASGTTYADEPFEAFIQIVAKNLRAANPSEECSDLYALGWINSHSLDFWAWELCVSDATPVSACWPGAKTTKLEYRIKEIKKSLESVEQLASTWPSHVSVGGLSSNTLAQAVNVYKSELAAMEKECDELKEFVKQREKQAYDVYHAVEAAKDARKAEAKSVK